MYACVQADEAFLQSLFKGLSDDGDDDDDDGTGDGAGDGEKACNDDEDDDTKLRRRQDAAQFLKEFCIFSQTLAPQNRDNFFKVHCLFMSDFD